MQDRVYKFWLADPVGESIKAGEGMTQVATGSQEITSSNTNMRQLE